jgi:hypothetical protein
MPNSLRVKLYLESYEERYTPAIYGSGDSTLFTSNPAAPGGHIEIDTSNMNNTVTEITITIHMEDGTSQTIVISIDPYTSAHDQAVQIYNALDAAGCNVQLNGNVVALWGNGTSGLESATVSVTGALDTGATNLAPNVNGFGVEQVNSNVNLPIE